MYENENSYIKTKRKNSKTIINDELTKKIFCFKSQKKKLSKNYIKTKRILHETTNKKKSDRFLQITFFENKNFFFDNTKKFLMNQKKFFNMQNYYENKT